MTLNEYIETTRQNRELAIDALIEREAAGVSQQHVRIIRADDSTFAVVVVGNVTYWITASEQPGQASVVRSVSTDQGHSVLTWEV